MKLRTFIALTLALAVTGCRKTVSADYLAAEQPRVTMLGQPREPAEVREAILTALANKSWVAESESGPEIISRLEHKGRMVRVSIVYDATRFSLKGIAADAHPKHYEHYLRDLENVINKRLRAAPSSAAVAPPPEWEQPGEPVPPAPTLAFFSREQDPASGKAALVRALGTHNWNIEADDASGIIARLSHRNCVVRIRVTFNATQATITYVSSEQLAIDPATGRSNDYERWLHNLVEAISAYTR